MPWVGGATRTNLGQWIMAFARKVSMKNKVCGPKDTCMRMSLGRWDIAYAQKVGMKNKVYGPKDSEVLTLCTV